MKVVYGLVFSMLLGFFSGYLSCKLVSWTCRTWTGAGPPDSSSMHRLARPRPWPSCTAPRTVKFMGVARNLYGNGSGTAGVRFRCKMLLLGSAAMALELHRRKENHYPIRWNGHGPSGEVSRLSADMAGPPACLAFHVWYPCEHHHTRHRHHGRRRREAAVSQLTGVVRYGDDLDHDLPGLRPHRFLIAKLFMMLFHGWIKEDEMSKKSDITILNFIECRCGCEAKMEKT